MKDNIAYETGQLTLETFLKTEMLADLFQRLKHKVRLRFKLTIARRVLCSLYPIHRRQDNSNPSHCSRRNVNHGRASRMKERRTILMDDWDKGCYDQETREGLHEQKW